MPLELQLARSIGNLLMSVRNGEHVVAWRVAVPSPLKELALSDINETLSRRGAAHLCSLVDRPSRSQEGVHIVGIQGSPQGYSDSVSDPLHRTSLRNYPRSLGLPEHSYFTGRPLLPEPVPIRFAVTPSLDGATFAESADPRPELLRRFFSTLAREEDTFSVEHWSPTAVGQRDGRVDTFLVARLERQDGLPVGFEVRNVWSLRWNRSSEKPDELDWAAQPTEWQLTPYLTDPAAYDDMNAWAALERGVIELLVPHLHREAPLGAEIVFGHPNLRFMVREHAPMNPIIAEALGFTSEGRLPVAMIRHEGRPPHIRERLDI